MDVMAAGGSEDPVRKSVKLSDIFIHGVHALFATDTKPVLVAETPLLNNPLAEYETESEAFRQSPAYRILKFLNTRELCIMARVCRATNYLISTRPELWERVDLSSCSPFSTTDDIVIPLLSRNPLYIHKLSLRFLTQLTNETIRYVANHLQNVTTIDLEGCSRQIDDSGIALLGNLPNLLHLKLAGCFRVTTRAIQQILSGCPNLISIDLSSIPAVNDAVLEALGTHPAIQKVKLNGCAAITDNGLITLASCRQKAITSLDLGYCDRVTDAGLRSLAPLVLNLEHISLYCCQRVTDEGIGHLVSHCMKLSSLNLSLIPQLTDVTLRRLAFQNHLRASSPPTEATFIPPRLKQITLYGSRQLRDGGFQMLQNCRNLEVLDLFGCVNLTRDRAAWILFALPKLRKLNIGGCPLISQQDIIDLSKHFTKVRFSR